MGTSCAVSTATGPRCSPYRGMRLVCVCVHPPHPTPPKPEPEPEPEPSHTNPHECQPTGGHTARSVTHHGKLIIPDYTESRPPHDRAPHSHSCEVLDSQVIVTQCVASVFGDYTALKVAGASTFRQILQLPSSGLIWEWFGSS